MRAGTFTLLFLATVLPNALPAEAQATRQPPPAKAARSPEATELSRSEACRAFGQMIEKGYGANPWGTPKDDARIGPEVTPLGDPRRRDLPRMVFGKFKDTDGREEPSTEWSYKAHELTPPLAACLGLNDATLLFHPRWNDLTSLLLESAEPLPQIDTRLTQSLNSVGGYRTVTRKSGSKAHQYLVTRNLEISLFQGRRGPAFVEITHLYENSCPDKAGKDPLHGNEMYQCGVLGYAWGTPRAEISSILKPLDPAEGGGCLECQVYEAPELRGRRFFNVPIKQARFSFNADERLTEVIILYENESHDDIAYEAVRLLGPCHLEDCHPRKGGAIWYGSGLRVSLRPIEDLRRPSVGAMYFHQERLSE